MQNDLILVGVITGAHGLKGEVRIRTFTAEPENIASYGPLQLRSGKQLTILGLRSVKEQEVIARVEESHDRNTAELLHKQELFVDRSQLPEPEDEEYYHNDLLDLDVITQENAVIGIVVAVQNYGASDILEIETPEGKKVMVPFIDDAIIDVNMEENRIVIHAAFVVG